MSSSDEAQALTAWRRFEEQYRPLRAATDEFAGEAALIGSSMLLDIPTRLEYMRMIRAEADATLVQARQNPSAVRLLFDRIYERRQEMRLIQQGKAKAATAVLSKLATKNQEKYQLLVSAANRLAQEGKLPAIGVGKQARSIPLEQLSPEQIDEVFLQAIDRAGGSRKSITPTKMGVRGAGLLLLAVALAGLDIYLAEDKSFAVTKNVSTIAGGAAGAWALGAAGLAVGGPLGGAIGLIVGGIVGSYAAEEVHFQSRGLHSIPAVDRLIERYHGWVSFDEEGLGAALHLEFLANLYPVLVAFASLNEKRNADADDVAVAYIGIAQKVIAKEPRGPLADALKTPEGAALVKLLYAILDGGWTTSQEEAQMFWLDKLGARNAQ
jgi:hypothetical protein